MGAYRGVVKAFEDEIRKLDRDKDVLTETNNSLRSEVTELESKKTVLESSIAELERTEQEVSIRITELNTQESEFIAKNSDLTDQIGTKQSELNELNAYYKAQETQITLNIGVLQGKSDDLSHGIIERQAQDNQTRENLADWSRKLEDREKNLRIREARVTQQEGAILRNSNLLNL